MTEWRFLRGWSTGELKVRMQQLSAVKLNCEVPEEEMTGDRGWHHYYSESVIAREDADGACFGRARTALHDYRFSDPTIVTAHFDPATLLLTRRFLLEVKVLGLRYLCPTLVNQVRDESNACGFRYATLDGHIERGAEWFLLTRNPEGELRFRIEAWWMRGELPNWWSHLGFMMVSGHYQRRWHREAHRRMSLLARFGSVTSAHPVGIFSRRDRNVTFTYHPYQKKRTPPR